MNVLFCRRCDFPISFSGRDTSRNVWNRIYTKKFFGRNGDLTKQYEVPSPEFYTAFWKMTIYSDTLHWWDITPIFDPLLIWTLLPNLILIVWGFHRIFATGEPCQQRTLTPPDTWSCPTLGLVCVLMSRPISPELVLFPDFWVSNIPRYFCFALKPVVHDFCFTLFVLESDGRSVNDGRKWLYLVNILIKLPKWSV